MGGSLDAKARLGFMHERGFGVPRNLKKAVELYEQSALLGNALGQAKLAFMYQRGHGVIKDYATALFWYQKAAAQDSSPVSPYAINALGYLYQRGWGVDKSYEKALDMHQKAAQKGYAGAYANLGFMHQNGLSVRANNQIAL